MPPRKTSTTSTGRSGRQDHPPPRKTRFFTDQYAITEVLGESSVFQIRERAKQTPRKHTRYTVADTNGEAPINTTQCVHSRATKASEISGLANPFFLLPRHRMPACAPPQRHRPSTDLSRAPRTPADLRDPSWKTCIHFYLFIFVVLTHVPL